MNYRTLTLCHLAEQSDLKVGEKIGKLQLIGVMGNTGLSMGGHVHSVIAVGKHTKPIRMSQIVAGDVEADINEFPYFIGDKWMFGVEVRVTTFPHDPRYKSHGKWKDHPGYDFVPFDRHITRAHYGIHWPRSFEGEILANGYDKYQGYYVHIGYEKK